MLTGSNLTSSIQQQSSQNLSIIYTYKIELLSDTYKINHKNLEINAHKTESLNARRLVNHSRDSIFRSHSVNSVKLEYSIPLP